MAHDHDINRCKQDQCDECTEILISEPQPTPRHTPDMKHVELIATLEQAVAARQ